jgi:endonuclease/exonuclease/phosphatase family metal-dependent hydrolase
LGPEVGRGYTKSSPQERAPRVLVDLLDRPPSSAPKKMDLKILTWNIHKGIGGVDRRYALERIAAIIRAIDPDIALLQEVADKWPPAGEDLQGELLSKMTPLTHFAYAPEHRFSRGGYGNAILSRHRITDLHRIDLKLGWRKQRSALQARVVVPHGDGTRKVVATSLHLGLSEGERRQQLARLISDDRLASRGGGPSILGGDFNDVFGTLGRRFPSGYLRAGIRERSFPAVLPVFCLDGIYARGFESISGELWRGEGCRIASDHLPLVARLQG